MNVPLVPSPATKCVMRPVGLLPDFGSRRVVVGAPVELVVVLIGIAVPLGLRGEPAARLANGAVRSLERIGEDQLGAVGAQESACARA